MYSKIEKMTPVYKKYTDKLLADGVITREQVTELEEKYNKSLTHSYLTSKDITFEVSQWKTSAYDTVSDPVLPIGKYQQQQQHISLRVNIPLTTSR